MSRRLRRRELLKLSAAAGGAAFLAACVTPTTTASPTPAATDTPGTAGKYPLGKLEGAELITDTSKYPKTFKEAPELAALVQQGKLPPVADRIGQDPLVYKPVHEIGKYGGILHKSFLGTQDGTAFRFANGPDSLLWFDWQWKKVVPNIARGFDQSADGKTLTIQLRRGMKWSDGVPFDVDDIMFWYNDIYKNKDLVSGPSADLQINGKDVTVEKVDQYTVRFNSPEPNYLLASRMAAGAAAIGGLSATPTGTALGMLAPAHYLKKLLPKYSSQAEIDKQAAAEKYTGWTLWFYDKFNIYLNVDLPTLAPWRTTRPNNDPNSFVMERNPYSIWVDTEGNQLPYIGTIQHAFAADQNVIALKAVAGEYDFQDRTLAVDQLAVLVDGQAKGGYKISLDPGQDGLGIILNLAYDKDAEIGELFRTTDFRRALSMGLDRDAINETFFLGTSVPGAPCPAKENPCYPGDEYKNKWATLDIAQANKLLDGLGYTNKSADGIRQRKDGKGNLQLSFMAVNRLANFPLIAEQIKIMWRKIGVDLFVDTVTSALAQQRIPAGDAQMTGNQAGGEEVFLSPDPVIGGVGYSRIMGLPYQQWVRTAGKQGKEPPQWYKDLYALWDKGYGSNQDERIKIGKQIHQTVIDQVLIIGLAGQGLTNYGIRLAKTNLGNQPGRVINAQAIRISDNLFPFMFYYR